MIFFFLFPPVKCKEFALKIKSNLQNGIGGTSFYRLSNGSLTEVRGHFMIKSLLCFDILVNQVYMS